MDGICIRRTNDELKVLYNEPNIIAAVIAQRLKWLGHVEIIVETRMPEVVLASTIGGRKRRGRPHERYKSSRNTKMERKIVDKII